ncbi:MAG TPA: AAA family ATPase [Candidatus Saccharimonadales bacterium]|nr:AAA family ATPase [Candidatus Saccharimonadales bacterium]
MSLIYITGMPSSGKSTVRHELQRKGFTAYGGAEDGLAAFFNNETGERINWVESSNRTAEWNEHHTWKIPRKTIEEIKQNSEDKPVFLCAVTRNDKDELWDLFDKVIALTIDEDTLKHRLATRTNNDVGKSKHELEILIERQKTAKVEYEKLGAYLVNATQPIDQVVEDIIKIATPT